jgi:hypothetical protein
MKKITFTLFICTLLAACAGGGIRYSIIETNAGSNIFDITARYNIPLSMNRAEKFIEDEVPSKPFARDTQSMTSYILSIGGACALTDIVVCVLDRREVANVTDAGSGIGGVSVKKWRMIISWKKTGSVVRPKVQLKGSVGKEL